MLSEQNYMIMKEKYGDVASWAIWEQAGSTAKSNTDSMTWTQDPDLLQIINTGFVFVGLNGSSTHGDQKDHFINAWSNFHSGYRYQHDYKLRFALKGTKYWGSYITDIIKHHSEVDSSKVKRHLKQHPEVIKENICVFEEEISYLGGKPILVAMGGEAYRILKENLGYNFTIIQITHYSFTISKEDYRREVLERLDSVRLKSNDADLHRIRSNNKQKDCSLKEYTTSKKRQCVILDGPISANELKANTPIVSDRYGVGIVKSISYIQYITMSQKYTKNTRIQE